MANAPQSPSHAERARTLAASRSEGVLSTLALDPAGHPYGSYVLYAMVDETPVFLLSQLAEHTKNLEADPRASLLVVEEQAEGEALARGRITLVGRCRRVDEPARAEAAFLARNPSARGYAGFADFGYWMLEVESARYVGGFGRMSWIARDEWRAAAVDPLLEAAPGVLTHMNEDHADACAEYARAFAGVEGPARMVHVDRYGFELLIQSAQGARTARVAFPSPVSSATEVRKALVSLLREARRARR